MKDQNSTSIIHKKDLKKLLEKELLYLINVEKSEEVKEELIKRIYRRLNRKVK